MAVSTRELAQAREIVGRLLDELRLDAYVFEVEPGEEGWEIRVECAVVDGWEACRLQALRSALLKAGDDPALRQGLLEEWAEVLSACLRDI